MTVFHKPGPDSRVRNQKQRFKKEKSKDLVIIHMGGNTTPLGQIKYRHHLPSTEGNLCSSRELCVYICFFRAVYFSAAIYLTGILEKCYSRICHMYHDMSYKESTLPHAYGLGHANTRSRGVMTWQSLTYDHLFTDHSKLQRHCRKRHMTVSHI